MTTTKNVLPLLKKRWVLPPSSKRLAMRMPAGPYSRWLLMVISTLAPPYTFADLLTGDGLDKEEFICFMAVLRKCFPSMGDDGSEGTATDPILRITKQDVGSFVSGIDREVPLPDIGKFEFFPSEDV